MKNNPAKGLPRGVILDMDGVLVDSEPFICRAARMMFAELGLTVQHADFVPFIGTGEDRFIGGPAEKYHFALDLPKAKKRTYDIYLEIIKGNLKALPGVHEFIERCRSMGKKLAVASSADLRKVRGNMAEIGLAFGKFEAVISGEDVVRKKPNPDIFLLAARRIGLNPQDCLVVEDAVSGGGSVPGIDDLVRS
ncbi:MAG: HAD-IA family hydrolase [Planctomycetaceae bacterium]|nr:HAD-IA family hydrolase [Planctomycetaceae bacterium]